MALAITPLFGLLEPVRWDRLATGTGGCPRGSRTDNSRTRFRKAKLLAVPQTWTMDLSGLALEEPRAAIRGDDQQLKVPKFSQVPAHCRSLAAKIYSEFLKS